jgi:predicted AAA+ superfamily ATPase
MQRYLEPQLLRDLACKTVVLTGARQVGKTTLARQLMERFERAQYLNWDVPVDRAVLLRPCWCSTRSTRCLPGNPGSRA